MMVAGRSLSLDRRPEGPTQLQPCEPEAIHLRDSFYDVLHRIEIKMKGAEDEHYKRMLRNNTDRAIAEEKLEKDREDERRAWEEEKRLAALAAEEERKEQERNSEQRWIEQQLEGITNPQHRSTWLAEYQELRQLEEEVVRRERQLERLTTTVKTKIDEKELALREVEEKATQEETRVRMDVETVWRQAFDVVDQEQEAVLTALLQSEMTEQEDIATRFGDEWQNALARARARVFSDLNDDVQEKVSEMTAVEAHRFLDELEEIRLLKVRLKRATSARHKQS